MTARPGKYRHGPSCPSCGEVLRTVYIQLPKHNGTEPRRQWLYCLGCDSMFRLRRQDP